jgi:hypothetical protein
LPGDTDLVSVLPLDEDRAVIVLQPGLGQHRWRRFEGCIEDMTLNRVTATADRVDVIGS